MSSKRTYLVLILAAYLLLALGFGAVNPLFEAPDEHSHYFTVQKIAETGRLPVVGPEPDPWMGQEAAQPPLYYVLGALLISPIDTTGAYEEVWPNPFVRLGDASWPVDTNAFVHGPAEAWPWKGYVLAAHLLRVMSALFGLGTLLCIYAAGRLLWPSQPALALLAAALVAFLPQFGFLHGAVSNDPLIIFLCSLALWLLLRLWLQPVTRQLLLPLGAVTGLAMLTKTAGLVLLPFSLGVLLLLAWRDRQWKLLGQAALLVLLPAAFIAGWLYWRNWTLYGDPTAANQFVEYFGGSREYTLLQALAGSVGIWPSLFAVFGWFNVRAPDWVFLVWNVLVLAALVLTIWRGLRRRKAPAELSVGYFLHQKWFIAVWLGGWVLLVFVGLVQFMLRTPAAQGRLVFPAILPLVLGFAWGLGQGLLRLRKRFLWWLAPLLALATALCSLVFTIPRAYAKPPVVSQLPANANIIGADLGQGVTLEAVDIETDLAHPGEWVYLTMYWQAGTVPSTPPVMVLVGFGRDNELDGKLQSYHGGGLYPANLWKPGETIADRAAIKLSPGMLAPTQLRLNVGIVGEPNTVDCGTVKVVPEEWPGWDEHSLALLGDAVELSSAEIVPDATYVGEWVSIDVTWQVIRAPGAGWTTFIHLGDPSALPVAQADSPPLSGFYPTSMWAAGEVIKDSYQLDLGNGVEPGQYALWIGMYDPVTMARVPLSVNGDRQPNDAYHVGWLVVE